MKIEDICRAVTGKPIGAYIDNGYFVVTAAQAKKLCAGKLPRPGYEKTMTMEDNAPAPSYTTSTHKFVIAQTNVSCRTDIPSGNHWTVRAW